MPTEPPPKASAPDEVRARFEAGYPAPRYRDTSARFVAAQNDILTLLAALEAKDGELDEAQAKVNEGYDEWQKQVTRAEVAEAEVARLRELFGMTDAAN